MKRASNDLAIARLPARVGCAALLLLLCATFAMGQDAAEVEKRKFDERLRAKLKADADAAAGDNKQVRDVLRAVESAIDDADARVKAAKEEAAAKAREAAAAAANAAAEEARKAAAGKVIDTNRAEAPAIAPARLEDPAAPYERALVEAKIEPSIDGLRAYLVSLHPGSETKKQLGELVTQLGDEAFVTREAAMTKLRQRSAIAMESLKGAVEHADPEIRWRAKKLLENAAADADATFFAIFKTIEARQYKGLTAPLLVTLPLCAKDHVRNAARKALAATATPNDAELLRQSLKNVDPQVRIAALGALANLSAKDAVDDALALADDRDDRVRMAAARMLAQAGKRESLPVLVSLLDAREVDIRSEAGRTLKAIAGQDFGFVAYDKDAERAAARDKWKVWFAAEGQSAKLLLPLKDVPFELGRVLICSYASSKVYEFDADAQDPAKPRWEVQMGMQPWAVQGLQDGRRLVAYYGGRKVVEFGPENDATKPVWESEMLPGGPMGMHRLENGNTVVACTDAELVVELDAQGKITKKWPLPGRPVDVERLENGHTLVTLQNGQKVVEIDSEGQTVWSTKVAMLNPFSAQRLENGNTLVAVLSQQKVIEINRDGDREEWTLGGLVNPYHAERLTNGNTLVVDQKGVYEYETVSKKQVWKLEIPHVSRASRF